ncbi:hypothetical protein ACFQGU_16750 [Longivirga aurantiaca]|uniref:Uncharacterized protein n=1 Tax=Longivirga aurantiaca TaxID=1837743 RepID=A0ABW1T5C6_9ACTN
MRRPRATTGGPTRRTTSLPVCQGRPDVRSKLRRVLAPVERVCVPPMLFMTPTS